MDYALRMEEKTTLSENPLEPEPFPEGLIAPSLARGQRGRVKVLFFAHLPGDALILTSSSVSLLFLPPSIPQTSTGLVLNNISRVRGNCWPRAGHTTTVAMSSRTATYTTTTISTTTSRSSGSSTTTATAFTSTTTATTTVFVPGGAPDSVNYEFFCIRMAQTV